jgi:Hereditary spastic paraplegia protein strumpellin
VCRHRLHINSPLAAIRYLGNDTSAPLERPVPPHAAKNHTKYENGRCNSHAPRSNVFITIGILAGYPESFLARLPVPQDVIGPLLSRLRSDDVYTQILHYPSPEHRSTALAQQVHSEVSIILLQ